VLPFPIPAFEDMIDRAVKRLIQIKVMKQMLGQTGTELITGRERSSNSATVAKDTSHF
jgi:hypothetical protein